MTMSVSGPETSILDCPLCLKTFEDPRILPCQHSACEKCLSSYIKDIIQKGGQQTGLPCPVCKRKTKFGEASSFKKSLTIAALLDSKQLKTKIQKASAKKKIKARTTGTQTSFVETHTGLKDNTNVSNAEKDAINKKDETGKHLENGNSVMETTTENDNARNHVENNIPRTVTVHVPLNVTTIFLIFLFCNFMERFILLYILIVFDIAVIVVSFFLPYFLLLIISLDLIFNHKRRLILINKLYEERILARKKLCLLLLMNLEWLWTASFSLFMIIISSAIHGLFDTFWRAISEKQAVFTFDILAENCFAYLLGCGLLIDNLNDKLYYLFNDILRFVMVFKCET